MLPWFFEDRGRRLGRLGTDGATDQTFHPERTLQIEIAHVKSDILVNPDFGWQRTDSGGVTGR